jgi:hypothetical protein
LDDDGVWRLTVRRWRAALVPGVAAGLFGYASWAIWGSIVSNGMDPLGVLLVSGFALACLLSVLQAVIAVRFRATAEIDPASGVVRLSERVFRTRSVELRTEDVAAQLVYFRALVPLKHIRGLLGPALCLEGGGVSVCVMCTRGEEYASFVERLVDFSKAVGIRRNFNARVDRCGI